MITVLSFSTMRRLYSSLFIGLFTTASIGLLAQPTVETGLTLDQYVNEILLGSGVNAFNITLTGAPVQVGYMTNAEEPFPLPSGLVLSSAQATNIGCGTTGDVPFGSGVSGDPDLLSIAQSVPAMIGQNFNVNSVNDICAIEFDFIATGDTIRFNYVFGSDEYLTWVNSSFNDVFAFFLSGPGVTGPYNSPAGFPGGAVNIAYVPDTDPQLPITISSVNNVLNSQYYIHNIPNGNFCQNGFTTPFTAEYEVECGETYHIKLAIADGSDTALESIVILEEGSFVSNSVVEVDLSIDVGYPDSDIIYEDCGTATLTFTRPIVTNLDIEEMIIIQYGGEAINGVDYTLMPDTIIFLPGVQSVSFELQAFQDGIDEGIESVQFEILNLAACNGSGLVSYFEFFIADDPEPLVVEGYVIEMCDGAQVELEPVISGGYGNFTYEWSTNESTPTITVSPPTNQEYNVIVSDTCGMPSDDADISLEILMLPPLEVNITNGDIVLNCNQSIFLSANAQGGDGVYSWTWTNQNGASLNSSSSSLFYNTQQGATQIIATATDGCGFVVSDTINVTLNVPALDVTIPEEVNALCLEQFTITPVIQGGQAPFNYTWEENGNWASWNLSYSSSSDENLTYTFEVTDACGQVSTHVVELIIESPPVTVTLPESLTGPCTQTFNLNPDIEGGSGGFQYTWTADGENYANTLNTTWQSFEDAVLEFHVIDQCGAEDNAVVEIFIVNPPVVINIGEDIEASCLDNTLIDIDIISGSGNYEYEWFVADTAFAITEDIVVQSFITIPVGVQVTDGCGSSAFDELMYIIPDVPLTLDLHVDTAICAGTGISIYALATGGEEGWSYFWSSLGASGPDQYISPYQSSTYPITATELCGKTISGEIFVEVQYLFSNFTVSTLTDDNAYQFFASPSPDCPGCQYLWEFGDGNTSTEENPVHVFDGLSDYTTSLQVTNAIGCTNTAYTLINGPVILYVPNAFTPNNDGINDVFRVTGSSIARYNIQIFNRWGEVVFESDNIEEVWDGSHQGGTHYSQNDIYSYVIKVKGFDTDAFERSGHISVMR